MECGKFRDTWKHFKLHKDFTSWSLSQLMEQFVHCFYNVVYKIDLFTLISPCF
jgi:hypothetical protein